MKKTLKIIFLVIISALMFIAGGIFGIWIFEDDGNPNTYEYPHSNYLGENILSTDIQHYYCFSNGLTINDTDIYDLSCDIIENAVKSSNSMLNGVDENIDADTYNDLTKSLIYGEYIDGSFAYDITNIDYYNDKAIVEFIYCYDYNLYKEIYHADAHNYPAYMYMRYDEGIWIVEYVDFYKSG